MNGFCCIFWSFESVLWILVAFSFIDFEDKEHVEDTSDIMAPMKEEFIEDLIDDEGI